MAAPSIRLRLTGWYSLVLFLMLVIYAAATFVAVRQEFQEQLDVQLHDDFEAAEGSISAGADGRIMWADDRHHDPDDDQDRGSEVVALAGLGGYFLGGRALAPIDRLASEARRITADRLHERLSVPNLHDEIGRLAAVINETFARLEASFDQLRRFTADASHELRTPLSVIRGIGEMELRQTRTPDQYKDAIGSMLEEVDRLTHLVDTLLRLSHGDAGTVRLVREPVDLAQLARDIVSSLGILAEERSQQLKTEMPDAVVVSADRLVLREAITNVVDNAIKYSPVRSEIVIRVRTESDRAIVEVVDQGPGIAAEQRERIFDRLFRTDEGRSRDSGGTGLGLAIAKWAIEVSGGTISSQNAPGGGSIFRIVLPVVASTLVHHHHDAFPKGEQV